MRNILTFDVEDWNQRAYRRISERVREPGTHLYRQLDFLLQLLADHETKATFFVLGMVAEKRPVLRGALHRRPRAATAEGVGQEAVTAQAVGAEAVLEFLDAVRHRRCLTATSYAVAGREGL